MTYNPNPGDIGLVKMAGSGGYAIRALQWLNGDGFEDFEHAFDYVGNSKIVEAMPGGARLADLSRYDGLKILWLRCPAKYGAAVAQEAINMIGVPYSWADYGALALHRFGVPTRRLKHYMASRKSAICSQLVDRAAMRGGWHIFADNRDEGDVTPGDLTREALKQHAQ